ncbi:hypothetical protein L2Y96_08530 [Luteibacter aegosomaticola]|uniref:hypothetical protein n=1 Tax=Luteibacter aegosomaticola TaxID=2911538 RepID=UPI001FF7C68B|nr:hypothetical protein [Luteibacter aegosomaticola]UPG91794.1 hypothetical protein L2Y96_08530 [Luteibacter aegosomaticola]
MDQAASYWEGEIEISVEPHEMRMSHWVYAPKVTDISAGRVLFDLTGKLWDLTAVTETEESLLLRLRKYPGDRPEVDLLIQRNGRGLLISAQPVDEAEIERYLDAAMA